jgi:hypothetical protein
MDRWLTAGTAGASEGNAMQCNHNNGGQTLMIRTDLRALESCKLALRHAQPLHEVFFLIFQSVKFALDFFGDAAKRSVFVRQALMELDTFGLERWL